MLSIMKPTNKEMLIKFAQLVSSQNCDSAPLRCIRVSAVRYLQRFALYIVSYHCCKTIGAVWAFFNAVTSPDSVSMTDPLTWGFHT